MVRAELTHTQQLTHSLNIAKQVQHTRCGNSRIADVLVLHHRLLTRLPPYFRACLLSVGFTRTLVLHAACVGEISLVRQKDNSKIAVEELLDILPYRVGAQTTKPDRDEHAQEPTEEDPVDADDELEQKPGLRRTRSASAPATEGAAVPGRRKHTGGRGTKPPQKLDESDARKGNRARSTSRGGVKKIKLAPAAASATPSPVLRSDAAPIAPLQPSAASNCCIYRLRAAIIHHGSGVGKGHYTAFARPGPAANRGLPGGEVASSVRAEGPGSEEEYVLHQSGVFVHVCMCMRMCTRMCACRYGRMQAYIYLCDG